MAKQPEKLGKYDIVGKLGKGAMGEVYKGHDPVLNRHVAIKVIAESLDTDSDLVERFRREAKMAAQLNHPNIITIYDFVEEEGNLYIVMELLDGQDLKDLIKSGSPLTVDQILGIMEQITEGLGFAHDAGMVHRDLKPANIHITKKGQIKILDFGLVHEDSSDMTKTGHIMGTPNYMSPEQVQGMKVDPRSDIFSLGAVFYELLTRKKPFSADSIHATMFKVVQGEREPLSQYTHLPAPLVSMVDRALDPNPDGRYNDGNAMREHLRGIRKETMRGESADATMTGVGQDATILTPGVEHGSHPSHPSARPAGRSSRSVPARAGTGASASGSRGGTMRRREMASHSVGAAGASRPMGLYIGGAVVVAIIAGALFYLSGGREPQGASVEELARQLSASQQELMLQSLEGRDYTGAMSQADALLADNPQNAEALRVQREAREALDEIDSAVNQARDALERGATNEAAEALGRVLTLDPMHPLGAELHDQLNQHFQSQAEGARSAMESARNAASSAGAASRAEFRQADQTRQDANADFNRGEYTNAAQKYLAARDQFQHSQSVHRQAEASRRQNSEREAASQASEQRALQTAQANWTRLRNQPADAGLASQPSYQRAMSEEAAAQELERSGDRAGAARAYDTATSYLEAARREYTEAQSRRAAASPPPASSSVPSSSSAPATSSAPTRAQEEAAIRQVLATYERAIESKDIDLFRQTKPNLTSDEAKRLTDSFEVVDSQDVELDIRTVTIEGDTASAVATRQDVITIRGRSQNGSSRQQTFVLQKAGGSWVITQIQ
jgi:tRNA A-37 threonylcarbamoyl transferase component Bud32